MRAAVVLTCAFLVGSSIQVEARRGAGVHHPATRKDNGSGLSTTALQPAMVAAGRPLWTHVGNGLYSLRIPIWNVGEKPVTAVQVSMPGLASRVLVGNWYTLAKPLNAGAIAWLDARVVPGADPLSLGTPRLEVKGFSSPGDPRTSTTGCDMRRWPPAVAPWPATCDLRPIAWPAPASSAVFAL